MINSPGLAHCLVLVPGEARVPGPLVRSSLPNIGTAGVQFVGLALSPDGEDRELGGQGTIES